MCLYVYMYICIVLYQHLCRICIYIYIPWYILTMSWWMAMSYYGCVFPTVGLIDPKQLVASLLLHLSHPHQLGMQKHSAELHPFELCRRQVRWAALKPSQILTLKTFDSRAWDVNWAAPIQNPKTTNPGGMCRTSHHSKLSTNLGPRQSQRHHLISRNWGWNKLTFSKFVSVVSLIDNSMKSPGSLIFPQFTTSSWINWSIWYTIKY